VFDNKDILAFSGVKCNGKYNQFLLCLVLFQRESEMSIKDWAADDRPREKLLIRGPGALTDAELLAIFLRTGTHGKSAVDLARDLLEDFGSLKALLSADQQRFCKGHGLGEAKYTLTSRHGNGQAPF
jgi:hypothetical protein